MITQITTNNQAGYNLLFRQAEIEAGYPEGTIGSLSSYFAILEKLSFDKEGNRTKYTILPVDEGYLDIDANTRKITLPENFRKHGISVEGDQIAETLYFKINRYFDAMDLDLCNIFIQWEEVNNPNNCGVSVDSIRDKDSFEDYLVFGWPIDSRITSVAGNIKFSVRFISWDDQGEINYSFSTLDTIATIQPALNFDNAEGISIGNYGTMQDYINNILNSRIKNSQSNDTNAQGVKPTFIINLLDGEADLIDGELTLSVEAISTDTIDYTWKRNGQEIGTANNVYVAVPETTILNESNKRSAYYKKDGEKYSQVNIDITANLGKTFAEISSDTLYTLQNQLVIDRYGEYNVTASNTVVNPGEDINTFATTSNTTIVPGAMPATFASTALTTLNMIDNDTEYFANLNVVPASIDNKATHTYQWVKTDNTVLEPTAKENNSGYTYTIGKPAKKEDQIIVKLKIESSRNKGDAISYSNGFQLILPPIVPEVIYQIDGSPVLGTSANVGQKIKAIFNNLEDSYQLSEYTNEPIYTWYLGTNTTQQKIATGSEYTIDQNCAGYKLWCEITNNYNEVTASNIGEKLSISFN